MVLIPKFYFDCVAAMGIPDLEGKFEGIASGFLYGHCVGTENERSAYVVYLVSNRHVFDDCVCDGFQEIYLRFNPRKTSEPAREYKLDILDKDGESLWYAHPNRQIDVAVMPINFNVLKEEGMQANYFRSDKNVADIGKLVDLEITEGDFVYVLGFPMGIVGETRSAVIARSGTIARLRDTLTGENPEYFIDAFIFPGNSGGPVIVKPEISSIAGTKAPSRAYLIGIVRRYISYVDEAISRQTQETRVIFAENSGLAKVYPIDFVQEAIKTHSVA